MRVHTALASLSLAFSKGTPAMSVPVTENGMVLAKSVLF